MAYGPVNIQGITVSDLDPLRADIIRGEVTSPLCTSDGVELTASDGKPLHAYRMLDIFGVLAAALSEHNQSRAAHPSALHISQN